MSHDSACSDMPVPSLAGSPLPNKTPQGLGAANIVPADRLFQGNQEILIDHNGVTYRLRITKNSKLILTK